MPFAGVRRFTKNGFTEIDSYGASGMRGISGFRFRVSGFGFRVSGLRFGIWGLRFGGEAAGVHIWGAGFRAGSGCTIWDRVHFYESRGFRASGFGFQVSGFVFRVSGFGSWVSGFRFRVAGFGCRVWGVGLRVETGCEPRGGPCRGDPTLQAQIPKPGTGK